MKMKYLKKALVTSLAAAMLAGSVNGMTVFAEEAVPEAVATLEQEAEVETASVTGSGTCGENATWSYADGVLTISGSGEMTSAPWRNADLRENIKRVVIQKGITSIGEFAFSDCSSLTSITIPESVTSIGEYAFSHCTSLREISIPKEVTSIGHSAFFYCSSLNDINIPEGVTSIESEVFMGCSSLTNVNIPEEVLSIGDGAFYGCSSLCNINIPEKVKSIGYSAFADCSSLSNITIPEGITSIEEYTFAGCSSLSNITLPEAVTSIGASAFADCSSLSNIMIPKSVTSIGETAFFNCSSLMEIKVEDGNQTYMSIDGCLLSKDKKEFIVAPAGKRGKLIISEGVENIEYNALSGCAYLTEVMVPSSVKNIEECGLCVDNTAPIYFAGNAVEDTGNIFYDQWYNNFNDEEFMKKYQEEYKEELEKISNKKVYYIEGTSGWEELKAAYPRIQWLTWSGNQQDEPGTVPYYNLTEDGGTWDGTYYTKTDGTIAKDVFFFDGNNTYYLQADGTPMKDRLTYHPDGEHIIYLDKSGHEVFNSFQYCPSVGYTCYFDSNGYIYKDQITFVGDKTYYLNGNGKLENEGWFQFANRRDFGYANWDGTLTTGGFSYDPWGRVVFYHWNGMVARGLITDGAYYYLMDETDGHYLGSFPVN